MLAQWQSDLIGKRVEVETGDFDHKCMHRGVVRAIGATGDRVMIAVELVVGTDAYNTSSRVINQASGSSPSGALALFQWGYHRDSDGCAIRVVEDIEARDNHYQWRLPAPTSG